MTRTKVVLSQEQIQSYVVAAAKESQYEGFGAEGCDLNLPNWRASYTRQSLEEQTQNNRLPDYLRTCAHQAKELGAGCLWSMYYLTLFQVSIWRDPT